MLSLTCPKTSYSKVPKKAVMEFKPPRRRSLSKAYNLYIGLVVAE